MHNMVLNFNKTLQEALETIKFQDTKEHIKFIVPQENHIEEYGKIKWAITDSLNERYSQVLREPFDLYNWLHYNEKDEVSYFLSEAGSNSLHHSQFKMPDTFLLFKGRTGFIIGIQQQGDGFNALEVNDKRIKDNEGAAFDFFRRCTSTIFFDNAQDAKIVYFEFLF